MPRDAAGLGRAHRVAAEVLLALVLAQAVVAGHYLFGDWSIRVHGFMGNGSFVLGRVLLGIAVVGRGDRTRLLLSAVLVAALFAQTGLGYVGRETAEAAAWHVPLGVAIFGFTAYLVGRPVAAPGPPAAQAD